jgi:hypothetical protein
VGDVGSFFWDKTADMIFMLLVYSKSRQEDLTPEQLKMLKRLMQEEFYGKK